jgi:HK97 family phage major capsid protein
MSSVLDDLSRQRDERIAAMDDVATRLQALPDDAPDEERDALNGIFERESSSVERLTDAIRKHEIVAKARQTLQPQDDDEPKDGKTSVRVGKEPLTYERNGKFSFFADLNYARNGDAGAQQRLHRHSSEMRVELRDLANAATTGGEFVPPLWLQAQWVELLRAARPTADVIQSFPLPPNTTSINLPKLATGTATAIQTADNAAVQETDATTGSVSAGVKTIAGQQDMSRQLYEFSQPGLDEVLFRDLARDYATKLDVQVLSGSGSGNQALGIRNVSGINAVAAGTTATAVAVYPKIADAVQRINSAFLNPDTIVMHPRRWGWFIGALDSSNRPLMSPAAGPFNAMGMGQAGGTGGQGYVGQIQGLRVILDPNLPTNVGAGTNEDIIVVFDSNQLYLWEEGAPRTRVFEDIGSGTLTVRLSVWGYFAFMGNRYPAAISVVSGTALVTPTF